MVKPLCETYPNSFFSSVVSDALIFFRFLVFLEQAKDAKESVGVDSHRDV